MFEEKVQAVYLKVVKLKGSRKYIRYDEIIHHHKDIAEFMLIEESLANFLDSDDSIKNHQLSLF